MRYDSEKHHRHSVRLKGYNYAQCGAYFVTLCADRRRSLFGKIVDDAMCCNVYGRIAYEEWERTAIVRPAVIVDEFIVMPNHIHGILIFTEPHPGTVERDQRHATGVSLQEEGSPLSGGEFGKGVAGSLGTIIGQYKLKVKSTINYLRAERGLPVPVEVWQRSFHDHIIRDEDELNVIRRYIIENPLNWILDEHHPKPGP